jgi:Transcriptional regulators
MPVPTSNRCHCIALRRANKAVTDFYDERMRPCGVTINQFALLRTLEKLDGQSVSELAQRMRLERTTLVRSLQPLIAAGMVEDGAAAGTRNRRLRLTASGRKVLLGGAALWENAQREFERRLGQGNTALWYEMLDRLRGL